MIKQTSPVFIEALEKLAGNLCSLALGAKMGQVSLSTWAETDMKDSPSVESE